MLEAVEVLREKLEELHGLFRRSELGRLVGYEEFGELLRREVPDRDVRAFLRNLGNLCRKIGGGISFEKHERDGYERYHFTCLYPEEGTLVADVTTGGGSLLTMIAGSLGKERVGFYQLPEKWTLRLDYGEFGDIVGFRATVEKETVQPDVFKYHASIRPIKKGRPA